MRSTFLALTTLLLVPATVQAQEASAELTLVGGTAFLPHDGTVTSVPVQWGYRSDTPLAGNATLTWSVTCPDGTFQLAAPVVTLVEFQAATMEAEGTVPLPMRSLPEAPGLEAINCEVAAALTSVVPGRDATAQAGIKLVNSYRADISAVVSNATRTAGPQKAIPYMIELENRGNARTVISFEILEVGKGWVVLAPEPVALDPGYKQTIPLIVSTPYDNGYNAGATDIVLQAIPAAFADPDLQGEAARLTVQAKVEGFYVPGPQLPMLVAAIGLGIALRRRR